MKGTSMIYLAPSLLAANFANLAEDVKRVEDGGANYLHLDIMDGAFVPNISFGACVVSALREQSKLFFDVHLMIMDPIRYIDDFIRAGADSITIHYESCGNCREVLEHLRDNEVRAALAISPDTPWDVVIPYLDLVDMILVMTVNPGFGGQSIIYATLDKVKQLRQYLDKHEFSIDIQVDGGINEQNIGVATASGANVIVAGSAIFKAPRPRLAMANMREVAEANPYKS